MDPQETARRSLNALPPGTALRDYVIESELGSGGFSIVYLARHHLKSDWLYAIKEYFPGELTVRGRDGTGVHPVSTEAQESFDDGLRRFRDEAEQLRKFRNEGSIVSCLNYFEENGTAYLVMDYDDGLPLSELLRLREEAGQPFTEEDLLAVVEPLLEGLAVVHRAGVLHRDIKPGNIFVRRQDDITGRPAHPVLIDFGAAKQNYLARHSRSRAPYTPGYAAYEQVSSIGEIGPWTDLYAVGALMWRMVAGGCPEGERLLAQDNLQDGTVWSPTPQSADQRVYALYSGRPDPVVPAKELGRGRFSPHLLAAIDACLVLDPNDRVQSSEQLKELLDRSDALDSENGSDGSELESIGDWAGAHSRQPTEQRQVENQRHPDEGTGVRKELRNIWRTFTRRLKRHEQRRSMFPGRVESRNHSKALRSKRRQATLGRTPPFRAVGIAATVLSAFSLGAALFLRIPLSPEQVGPSYDNVLFSAMRNQNSLLNLAGFTYEYFAFDEDPQFSSHRALSADNYTIWTWTWEIRVLAQSRSRAEYEYLKRKVRQERQDDNALYHESPLGFLAAISAAISDPVVFFPVGILVVLALRRGFLTTRRASLWGIGIGAVLCGSSVAVQQLILRITPLVSGIFFKQIQLVRGCRRVHVGFASSKQLI